MSHALVNSTGDDGVVEIKRPPSFERKFVPGVLFLLDLLYRFAGLRRGRRDGFSCIPFIQSHDHGMDFAGLVVVLDRQIVLLCTCQQESGGDHYCRQVPRLSRPFVLHATDCVVVDAESRCACRIQELHFI